MHTMPTESRSNRARLLRLIALASSLAILIACAGCGASDRPPSIVLITLDTTRADHLPIYGYFRDTAPALSALADESIVFDRLIVPMATTLPTHMSILTGTYPLEHGVLANAEHGGRRFRPSSRLDTFATLSQQAGYATAAFVSATPLKRGSGAETGFDVFDQPLWRLRRGKDTSDAALAWLARQGDEPFFLWVHYYDAHFPYNSRGEYGARYQTDWALERFIEERKIPATAPRPLAHTIDNAIDLANGYDGEIRYVDDQMARVLAALRARPDWDRTAVVVTGDHGEGLCQHGLAAHGSTWNEQLHAPLVMRIPGESPRRVDTLMSAVDILPTLAAASGLPQADAFASQASGTNVLSRDFRPRAVISQDTGRKRSEADAYRYALNDEGWKFFRLEHTDGRVSEELYDLRADPYELSNLAQIDPERAAAMSQTLTARLAFLKERGLSLRGENEPTTQPADPQIIEELKSLGYVVDDIAPEEPTAPRDP
jgi:arylsulfatase A-like enzyme